MAGLIIEGSVTEIMPKYCYFTIDRKIKVYLGLYYIQLPNNSCIQFPELNSTVEIEYYATNFNEKILYPEKLKCNTIHTNTDSILWFLNYLQNYNISQLNAIEILSNCDKIHVEDKLFCTEFLTSIKWERVFEYTDLLLALTPFCENFTEATIFEASEFSIFTPNSHKLVEDERARRINVVKWNFGVNNFDRNQYLIGYLEVSTETGYVVLTDAKNKLICQIGPGNPREYSQKLTELLNNFVIIKNYVIFSENTANFGSLDYIFVCIDDVEVFISRNVQQNNEKLPENGRLHVISRSSVSFDFKTDNFECYCHCLLGSKECFIRLNGPNFTKYPLFNSEDTYSVSNLQRYGNVKLNNQDVPLYIFPADVKFTLLRHQSLPNIYLPLRMPQLKKVIEQNIETHKMDPNITEEEKRYRKRKPDNKVVNFTGVIKRRNVMKDSFAPQPIRNPNFGVRGRDVHQINFKSERETNLPTEKIVYYSNDDLNFAEKQYFENFVLQEPENGVSVFLHNFRALQTPLSLVPDMTVTARYMFNPRDKYYLKPSNLTRIEPLQYNPPKKFNTTSELIGNSDWGPSEFLGQSAHIPPSCLIWGTALVLHITTLSIFINCLKCKNSLMPNEPICCNTGPLIGQEWALTLGLRGTDPSGPFDALAKEDYNLKTLFGLRDDEWKLFRKMIIETIFFNTSSRGSEEVNHLIDQTRNVHQHNFKDYLKVLIEAYNYMGLHNFDLKCRKMKQNEVDSLQKFYLVEARPNGDDKNIYYAF